MRDYEPPDESANIWPPAIALPPSLSLDSLPCKTARFSKASLWAAGVGIACWVSVVAALTLLVNLHQTVYNQDAWVHTAYFLGLTCERGHWDRAGRTQQKHQGRQGWSGTVSLRVVLNGSVHPSSTHQASDSGGWIWNANEGDCGCDDRL